MIKELLAATAILLVAAAAAQNTARNARPRASDLGLKIGILPTGPLDAITDVAGVEVGHATIIRDDDMRTGVTAILPHSGNLFREKVPGAVFVGNAFGKLAGSTQVNELGEIETPILLTSTLSVPRVADALIDYMGPCRETRTVVEQIAILSVGDFALAAARVQEVRHPQLLFLVRRSEHSVQFVTLVRLDFLVLVL
jgi:L-aminopeptidase/D-esterase-like protein